MTPCPYCADTRDLAGGPCVCAPWSRVEHLAPGVTLYCGDSLEVLPALVGRHDIVSVVCDPPYGLGAHPDPRELLRCWLEGRPYAAKGAGFMGKEWDAFVPGPEIWRPVMDLLPPGAHMLAAFGTRTYDLGTLAVRLADAEIRDQICWIYGSGFPKSLNVNKVLEGNGQTCVCHKTSVSSPDENVRDLRDGMDAEDALSSGAKPNVQPEMRSGADLPQPSDGESGADDTLRDVRHACAPSAQSRGEGGGHLLQPVVPVENLCGAAAPVLRQYEGPQGDAAIRSGQPVLERRRDDASAEGHLQGGALCPLPAGPVADGADGRLCDGASAGHGALGRAVPDAHGDGAPHRPRPDEQPAQQSGALAGQREPQAGGAWPVCRGCGQPRVVDGLGTALKPALEPWVLARKPLSGTVAATILAHGVGALNIDACRVGFADDADRAESVAKNQHETFGSGARGQATVYGSMDRPRDNYAPVGRWPANLIHDGSDEVLAGFPASSVTGERRVKGRTQAGGVNTPFTRGKDAPEYTDTGSAARFFYCAKASKRDRDEGMDGAPEVTTDDGRATQIGIVDLRGETLRKNHHPTVKPEALMAYLCRLITPPGGTVLDPFMGSGSTGKAAVRAGFGFVGIERDPAYFDIAVRRVRAALEDKT